MLDPLAHDVRGFWAEERSSAIWNCPRRSTSRGSRHAGPTSAAARERLIARSLSAAVRGGPYATSAIGYLIYLAQRMDGPQLWLPGLRRAADDRFGQRLGVVQQLRGNGPLRVMSFLEHARAQQILRRVGTQYEFRPGELADYLSSGAAAARTGPGEREDDA